MPEDEKPSQEDFNFVAPKTGEAEVKLEVEPGGLSLEALVERLGFVEDETAKALRGELIKLMQESADLETQEQAYNAWRAAAELLDTTPESHIGLVISQTLIFHEAELHQMYVTELKIVLDNYGSRTDQVTMSEVVKPLEAEVVAEIQSWPNKLSFHETPEIKAVREKLIANVVNAPAEEVTELLMLYTDLVNQIIIAEEHPDDY